jgi:hypothetical protein
MTRRKKFNWKSLLCFIIGFAFVVVTLGAVAWGSEGFKNWNTKEWFNSWGHADEETPVEETPATETPATETPATETPATDTPATDTPNDVNNTEAFLATPSEGNGIMVMCASVDASDSEDVTSNYGQVELTASVLPEDLTDKVIYNWEIDKTGMWADANIDEYFTIESDDNTATVTCLQPFGESASLKVTVLGSELYGACTLDFEPLIEDFTSVELSADGLSLVSEGVYDIAVKYDALPEWKDFVLNFVTTAGSVKTESGLIIDLNVSDELKTYMAAKGFNLCVPTVENSDECRLTTSYISYTSSTTNVSVKAQAASTQFKFCYNYFLFALCNELFVYDETNGYDTFDTSSHRTLDKDKVYQFDEALQTYVTEVKGKLSDYNDLSIKVTLYAYYGDNYDEYTSKSVILNLGFSYNNLKTAIAEISASYGADVTSVTSSETSYKF